jgi:release factor glutamine methyltransferase
LPYVSIISTDLSFQALRVAKGNIQKNQLEKQVHLVQADLLAGFAGSYDCICANLPYIPTKTLSTLTVRKYEPLLALDGGENGLKYIEPFLNQAKKVVRCNGLVLLEIESTISSAVFELASFIFRDASIKIHDDLAGLPRLVQIDLNGK